MKEKTGILAQLVHLTGPLEGTIDDLSRFPVTIGRHAACQLRFDDTLATISRNHARIELQEGRFRIVDTSTNGTYVNGKRISDVYLKDGDEIAFSSGGPTASFLIQLDPTESHASAPLSNTPVPVDADLTIGPDVEIPVVQSNTPILIQQAGVVQVFDVLPITLGSDPECDLVLAEGGICDRHIQLFHSDDNFYVKDLTGTEVVRINDRPVGVQSVLALGAILSLTDQGPRFRLIGGGKLVEIQKQV